MGKLIKVPDNVKREFEKVLTTGGLFKIVSQHPNYFSDTHYQILSTKPYEEKDWKKPVDKLVAEIDRFEEKYHETGARHSDIPVTWNFGYQDDKYISAGVDLDKMWVPDDTKDSVEDDEIHPNGGHIKIYEINGKKYKVYSDFSKRATIAEDVETGEKHNLSSSGYITNERTIKERIKMYFKDSDEELIEDSKIYYVIETNNKYVGWDDKLYGPWSEFVQCFNKPEQADKYAKSLDLNNYKIRKYDYDNKKVLDSIQDAKIFTVFPDDGSAPQDFNSLKEAINYGNKYHKQGFIIESPNDMDLYLHYVNGNKIEDSVKDAGDYIYLFPDESAMGDYKKECRQFGLTYLGKNRFQGERNLVIKGSLSNLKRYAKWLTYDLHPNYLYKEDEFAGDITDSEVKDVSMEQEEKLHNLLERDWTYLGKKGKEQVWQYTKPGYFPERVKSLRSIANDLISYVDMLDKKVYIKEDVKYDDSIKDARRINYDDDLIKVYLNGKEVYRGTVDEYIDDWDEFDSFFKWTGSQYEGQNSRGKWVIKVVDSINDSINDEEYLDKEFVKKCEQKLKELNKYRDDLENKYKKTKEFTDKDKSNFVECCDKIGILTNYLNNVKLKQIGGSWTGPDKKMYENAKKVLNDSVNTKHLSLIKVINKLNKYKDSKVKDEWYHSAGIYNSGQYCIATEKPDAMQLKKMHGGEVKHIKNASQDDWVWITTDKNLFEKVKQKKNAWENLKDSKKKILNKDSKVKDGYWQDVWDDFVSDISYEIDKIKSSKLPKEIYRNLEDYLDKTFSPQAAERALNDINLMKRYARIFVEKYTPLEKKPQPVKPEPVKSEPVKSEPVKPQPVKNVEKKFEFRKRDVGKKYMLTKPWKAWGEGTDDVHKLDPGTIFTLIDTDYSKGISHIKLENGQTVTLHHFGTLKIYGKEI